MKIGEKTIEATTRLIEGLLREHLTRINQGWHNSGETDFRIAFSVALNTEKAGIKQIVKIAYVVDKVDDTAKATIQENQTELFDANQKTRKCPKRDDDVEVFAKVCAKCRDRKSAYFVTGKGLPIVHSCIDIDSPIPDHQMVQFMSCRAWADEDYQKWCDYMIDKEIERKATEAQPDAKIDTKPKLKKVAGGKR